MVDQFAQRWCYWSKTKSEQCHCILHIQISLGTKFQLKLTKFAQKGISCQKRKNRTCACVHSCYLLNKTFLHGVGRHNSILMSLLILVAETIIQNLL